VTIVAFDTATPATAAAVCRGDDVWEVRHDPAAGERPGHASELLGALRWALDGAGASWDQVSRIAVGVGPGGFTGLRIGVATARALAQALGTPLVGVSTLEALARGAGEESRPVVAVIDARRGQAFAAAWAGDEQLLRPAALAPEDLAERVAGLATAPLAVGDGAIRFRTYLEGAGAEVPADGAPPHRVRARNHCRLAASRTAEGVAAVLPDYLRLPDAQIARRAP
jgi:tRNA threonylcarbamoyladenosine biosynthesis protein TsaB